VSGDDLFGWFLFSAFLGWYAWRARWTSMARRESWTRAARACDLVTVPRGMYMTGPSHPQPGLRVQFSDWSDGDRKIGTIFVVEAIDRGIVTVTLQPETTATARAKRRGAREIETGDDAFDDEFYVSGPSTPVRAVLDEETRRLLTALRAEVGLQVVNGELRGGVHDRDNVTLAGTLPTVLAAAHRLRRPADIAAALARNMRSDPQPRVRLENLLALVREYPENEITKAALRAGCDDANDEVRVRAATALGEEGRRTLIEIAETEHAEDGPSARAIAALGDHLSEGDMQATLVRALRTRRVQTARACLDGLARWAPAEAIPAIARVLAMEKGELAVAAAQALAETELPAAEAPLLAALSRDVPDVRVAAASALGRVGSSGAVLPLKEIETRYGDDATRRAARQAVAAIQSRLPGASPGQLSLAAADAGALSLAEDETGRLSLDEDRKR
jgi:HEAT repeat protein